MIKKLKKIGRCLAGHIENLRGDVNCRDIPEIWGTVSKDLKGFVGSDLRGNITGLTGCLGFDLSGEVTGLRGNITGVYGHCTGIKGNLDECGLTEEDRSRRVNIKNLLTDQYD